MSEADRILIGRAELERAFTALGEGLDHERRARFGHPGHVADLAHLARPDSAGEQAIPHGCASPSACGGGRSRPYAFY
jgi:hypothetical protein